MAQNNFERAIGQKKCVYPDDIKVANRQLKSGIFKRQKTLMNKHLAKLKFLTYDKFSEKRGTKLLGLYDELVAKIK